MMSLCTPHLERTMRSNSLPLLGLKYSRKALQSQVSHLVTLVYFALFALLNHRSSCDYNRSVTRVDRLQQY